MVGSRGAERIRRDPRRGGAEVVWRQHRRNRTRFYFFVLEKNSSVFVARENNEVIICKHMHDCLRSLSRLAHNKSYRPVPKYQESLNSIFILSYTVYIQTVTVWFGTKRYRYQLFFLLFLFSGF